MFDLKVKIYLSDKNCSRHSGYGHKQKQWVLHSLQSPINKYILLKYNKYVLSIEYKFNAQRSSKTLKIRIYNLGFRFWGEKIASKNS